MKRTKLRSLCGKVDKNREKYLSSIDSLVSELEKISGLELSSNDFPGDGLGIGLKGADRYISISEALERIESTGTLTESDFDETYL